MNPNRGRNIGIMLLISASVLIPLSFIFFPFPFPEVLYGYVFLGGGIAMFFQGIYFLAMKKGNDSTSKSDYSEFFKEPASGGSKSTGEVHYCPYCGEENNMETGGRFCRSCGKKILT